MFDFLKKEKKGEILRLKIGGMHCTSCSMNIDGALEDLEGVFESKTQYATATTEIRYDKEKIQMQRISAEIAKLGYSAQMI